MLGWMMVVFISIQVIDNVLFQPFIYGTSVKAHPLEIFLYGLMPAATRRLVQSAINMVEQSVDVAAGPALLPGTILTQVALVIATLLMQLFPLPDVITSSQFCFYCI